VIVREEKSRHHLCAGQSILSNKFIPCAHADPYYGTIEPGASAEATGEVYFTGKPIAEIVRAFPRR
jgi:hypothetical protein